MHKLDEMADVDGCYGMAWRGVRVGWDGRGGKKGSQPGVFGRDGGGGGYQWMVDGLSSREYINEFSIII